LTIGLDLGNRSSWYCVLDEEGEVLLEQTLGTTPKAMREVFGSMPRCRIALETGMHSSFLKGGVKLANQELVWERMMPEAPSSARSKLTPFPNRGNCLGFQVRASPTRQLLRTGVGVEKVTEISAWIQQKHIRKGRA
jgi:hypothetical protein